MDYINILSGLLTPTIAIITAYIAYQQYVTNKMKLQFELYEKRYRVYECLHCFLASIMRKGIVEDEDFRQFYMGQSESIFLFDKKVIDYLESVHKEATNLEYLVAEIKDIPIGEEKQTKQKQKREIKTWIRNQLSQSAEIFKPYLYFKA